MTEEIKEKKARKPFNPKNLRLGFGSGFEKLQGNLGALIVTCIAAFLIMMAVCFAVFFINVKGA